ncbi:MAG: helix-turn-helix transcriptional regulator [Candidatus Eremiobacteraeota bacterium]|nr:helix-turn-helix transcriptional regulator [Candidatus Eremiobacteraeota bacterium]
MQLLTTKPSADDSVMRVTRYIDEHIDEPLSLSALSDVAGLSITHLKRRFRLITGRAIHQYVLNARVAFAVREISSGRVEFADLAGRAGFADQSHMARWMKRLTGATPSAIAGKHEGLR